jgi:hypothetical protein
MATRPVSGGDAGSATPSAEPDLFPGARVLVAAAAGLVWALAAHGSSEDARHEPELTPSDTPKRSRSGGTAIGTTFEPVQQVGAEAPLAHRLVEVAVSGGDPGLESPDAGTGDPDGMLKSRKPRDRSNGHRSCECNVGGVGHEPDSAPVQPSLFVCPGR